MPEPSPAVFVSYASQDAAAAQLICAALRTAGIEVWFDRRELRGGDVWDQLIRRQIRECALFVPLISAATEARLEGYFRLEWKLAVERTHSMADEKPFLVPVVIDHTPEADAHVPEPFRALQWTRLPGGDATVSFVERIERLLSTTAPGPRPTTAVLKDSALRARPAGARPFASARLKLAVLLPVAAATLAIAYLGLLRSGATRTEPATGRFAETAGAAVAVAPAVIPEKSIAVLPFLDMSEKKDQEYFTDGLSEELLDLLAQVPDLRVAARTSSFYFKGKAQDVATIGQKLRVAICSKAASARLAARSA